MGGGHEVQLAKKSRLLEVTVGDDALRVFPRDQLRLHFSGEGLAPDIAPTEVVEVDSTHTGQRGVGGAEERGIVRHDLR